LIYDWKESIMSNFEIIMLTILILVTMFVAMLIGYRNGYADGHAIGFKRGRAASNHASVRS